MATIQAAPAMTLFLIDGAGLLFIDMICRQATTCPVQSCRREDQGSFGMPATIWALQLDTLREWCMIIRAGFILANKTNRLSKPCDCKSKTDQEFFTCLI